MAKIPLVDLKAQYASIKPEIDAAMARVVENTSFIGGKEVSDFEAAFAQFQQTKYAVGVASGTAAIFLALLALGVGPGDEVITTPHTFIASIEPIEVLGAKTVLVDIDPATFNIDPNEIEKAIGPRTRAVMIVPVYGNPCAMDAIVDICKRRNLILIEDCCEALGAYYDGKPVGKFGRVGTFSFYFSHHLTTLEGGSVQAKGSAPSITVGPTGTQAHVVCGNIQTANATVYIIDSVLMPAS